MPRIFVAYRPGPDQPAARRLYRIFAKRFGSDNVEQASSIPAGRDVRVAAEEEVSTADVLLVIIGPTWLNAADNNGNRLLERENDPVRHQIATGIDYGMLVIPVLIDGANLPSAADLPAPLRDLAYKQPAVINNDADIRRLIAELERKRKPRKAPPAAAPAPRSRRRLIIAGALLVTLFAGIAAALVMLNEPAPISRDVRTSTSGTEPVVMIATKAATEPPQAVPSLVSAEPTILYHVAWSGNDRIAVSASTGIYVFDINSPQQLLKQFDTTDNYAPFVAINADGTLLAASGLENGDIRLWNVETGAEMGRLTGHEGVSRGVLFNHEGTQLYSGGGDGTIRVWDVASGQQTNLLDTTMPCPAVFALNADGSELAAAGFASASDGCRGSVQGTAIEIWDFGDTTFQTYLDGVPVEAVAFSPQNELYVSAEKLVWRWNPANDQLQVIASDGDERSDGGMSLSPDGMLLAHGAQTVVHLYDSITGEPRGDLQGCHLSWLAGVHFSPDGTRVASIGAHDGLVCIWDVTEQTHIMTLQVA
ncbi:MAG: hypothetical protein CL610_29690 [Anaerolineaceae bacterium]|nr:hypothetical protein [Anaerolineaceae bacterium]